MAIAFVNRSSAGVADATSPTTSIASTAATHTGGNALIAFFQHDPTANRITSVTDTAGNTWHQMTGSPFVQATGNVAYAYYAYNITGHASNVVTGNGNGTLTFRTYAVLQLSGLGTGDPFNTKQTAEGTTSTGNETVSTSTLTLVGSPSEAIIVAFGSNAAFWGAAGTNYTGNIYTHPDAGGVDHFIDEYHIVTASEAASALISSSPPVDWAIFAVALSPSSASATATLGGTVTAAITEQDIVAGGRTIVVTLNGDQWIP